MKKFIQYIGLSMVSTLGYSLYVLADTLFIANGIGANGLTSLNLALPLYNLIFGIGLLLSVGGATKYAIAKSQGNLEEANEYFTLSTLLAIILSIPFLIVGFFYSKEVVALLGAKGEIANMTIPYLSTYMKFTPFFIFQYIITTFIKNDQNPRLVSIAGIIGASFNIIFDYIFIFPCHLGMFGAALATGIAPILSLSICLFHRKKATFHFAKIKRIWYTTKSICIIGFPALINELSTGLIILVFNYILLNIGGNIAVAAYGIISNLAIIISSLYSGITQGNQPLLSNSYGKNDLQQVRKYLHYALSLSFLLSLLIIIIFTIIPENLVSIFNSEGNIELAAIATKGIPLYFFGYFFSGINMVMISYFASIDHPQPSWIISICHGGLLLIPLVIILSLFLGIKGTWLSYPVSEFLTLLITYYLYKQNPLSS